MIANREALQVSILGEVSEISPATLSKGNLSLQVAGPGTGLNLLNKTNPWYRYMGIDKDILQTKFRNEHQKASINLLYTYNWVTEKTKEIFASEDITPQQFNILRILRGSYPTPLSTLQIRERMLDKMSDTSRIVDRLIAKGLVKKAVCKDDRRLVDVLITDKGKKMLERLDNRQDELDQIIGNLSKKEATILSELLDKIRNDK